MSAQAAPPRRVAVLSGGVGGARLVAGLAALVPPAALTVIVNTGDDFEHLGLSIAPDLDTVMYTLAGLGDDVRGWGLAEDRFSALAMIERYGGPAWFQLGDRDLGTHLMRTHALRQGATLSQATAMLCQRLGVAPRILPMSDEPCATWIDSDEGTLAFQEWLVQRRAAPRVRRVWRDTCPPPAPGVLDALAQADVVILGPSNPYVSIDPILSLPGVQEALHRRRVLALCPIVCGRAVKGPLAEMIPALTGAPASAAAIACHYGPLLTALVVEHGDAVAVRSLAAAPRVFETAAVMRDAGDRVRLAGELLAFAESLG